jgi:nitrate reductase gamma subunit
MELSRFQELVHLVATPVMIVLYTARLVILMRHRLVKDKSPDPRGAIAKGVADAFMTLVMPWKMESTRKHWSYYLEFMIFHLGLAFNISLAYLITFVPKMFTPVVRWVFIAFIAAGLIAGILRFIRRYRKPDLKIISYPDDYFSLFLVLLFNAGGILALRGIEWGSYVYFVIVGIFLIYAPFSKIHHYLYYPFARFFYGSETARKGTIADGGA